MVATEQLAVKVRTNRRALEAVYSIRTIVYADMREANRHGDLLEVARCRGELKLLEQQIDELTGGRGF